MAHIIFINLSFEQIIAILTFLAGTSWVGTFVALYQLRSQSQKLSAETHKTDAETESIKITTATTLMEEVSKLREELHQANAHKTLQESIAIRVQSVLSQVEIVMRELLNDSQIGFWEADKDGNRTHFNQHWLKMAGMERAEALGKGWAKAVHEQDRERIVFRDKAMRQREATIRPSRCRIKNKITGEIIWVEKVMFVIYDVDSTPYKFLGTMRQLRDGELNGDEELNDGESSKTGKNKRNS